ncbi:TspO and MBR related proteins [Desulfacinum hydrothermale DSM 13146]|uniref:TspO and MBR related proteins n=1 Tax=Desulfacinum hydrothermale DSM 13146 TaxID=1121390 RepID=A0A1W1XCR4_9BACT|nr:TspO/MBR family protein [Desulfacinum hydrothermale]SMC21683.1 TspO and MBR related proteins [Desulfacinum hydrothermale DSM 13146]
MKSSAIGLIAWVLLSMAAGWIGSRFVPGQWYASLVKPRWTPPNSVFGPVWSVLYLLMGIAAWLVWRKAGLAGARTALSLYLVQLVLNSLWSFLFFGAHRPGLAFLEIVVLWSAILATTVQFWRVSVAAGAVMLPYLLWVSFAAALNWKLWQLNA